MSYVFFTESSMNIGGQELQAIQQIGSLNLHGYKTILLCKPLSQIGALAKVRGIEVVELAFRNAFHFKSILRVRELFLQYEPKVILSHGSRDAYISLLGLILTPAVIRKKILLYRVKTFQHGIPIAFAYNYLFSKTLTPSIYLKNKFLENTSIKPEKIDVLYPGINFESLDAVDSTLPDEVLEWLNSHPGPVISHGAILRGEKGHLTILRALVLVKQSFPNVRYLIAGEGQDRPILEAEIIALGLSENVFLTGILRQIAPLIRMSDVAVLPSLIEPLGMFQIESQYLEIPTIVSDVGGIPETILDQKTGLMIESGNVEAWAASIIWVLSNPAEAKMMAKEGKKFISEKFSLLANTKKLIDLIEDQH